MITQDISKQIIEHCKTQQYLIGHNTQLFDIFEGDLLTYVIDELKATFSEKAFKRILPRVAPINVLKKIIDKLSKIYQQNLFRTVIGGNEQDSILLKSYEKSFAINMKMNQSNEFFNLFKNNLIQVYYDPKKRSLQVRVIPSNQFTVWSNDPIEPNIPTHVILYYGKRNGKETYIIYSNTNFVIVNEENEIQRDLMMATGNPEGIIPWGQMPFIYVNKSMNKIIPIQDTDTLKMTKLIPILLSDLNYAVMYQCFSIIYGIDVDDKNLEMNPSSFWHFKSDPTTNKKPEVGMIKPQVDIGETLSLIQSELAFWLETRGIKAGSMGSLDGQNAASGISKIIDEADTYEDRIKQIGYYVDAEERFWDLVLHKMHTYFVSQGMIDNKYIFTSTATVETKFPEQKPLVSRQEMVNTLKTERDAGFISTEKAIKRLNPEMSENDIDELMVEISEERTIEIPEIKNELMGVESNDNEDPESEV